MESDKYDTVFVPCKRKYVFIAGVSPAYGFAYGKA